MSLHKFAEQVAAHGRGDDSLLVHMTPDEVQRLQKFAEANGRTLTINPDTGLPEAGFLSDLFKAVAPIALGAFLGPAGFGLSATMAGVATGGITALATGSLSRGLMAGLGAYGGAGLGESLMGAGTSAGMTEALAGSSTGTGPQVFGDVAAAPGSSGQAFNEFLKSNANPATMTTSELASTGLKAAAANPLDFAKGNLGNLAYAAAPIAAGMMVPTTTKLETPKSDNYIRQFDFNINPDTGKPDPLYGVREMTPVKASEWGNKTFQGQRELFRQQNPNPYEIGVASLNQPPRMAGGGIVALAGGGVPGYANGALVSDKQIFDYFATPTPGRTDADIARDMQTYNVTAADIARATGTGARQGEYETRFVQAINKPDTSAAEFQAMTADVGLQNQALANAMQNAGMSQAAQYAATHNLTDTKAPQTDFYNQFGYTVGALPGDQGGLEGLYANINYSAKGLQDQINAGKLTVSQAQNLALAEMDRVGVNQKDIKAATGKDFGDLFTPKPVTKIVDTKTTVTGGGGNDVIAPPPFTSVTPTGFYGNDTGNPLTRTPGDITTNPDGTVTVQPNIPGRPTGGFPGMASVRDAYTAGGGSLGYTAAAPRTIAEFNSRFNKMTGDSVAAYDYLMGKGANKNAYPVKSGVPKISENYAEYVLGRKTTGLKPATTTVKPVVGVPGQPQTYFNEAEYLAANPDVAAELKTGKSVSGQPTKFSSGYEHWLMYGKAAGRPFAGDYQGYLTAAALANAATAGGGGGDSGGPGGGGGTGSGGVGGAGGPASTTAANSADMGDVGDSVDAKGGYYSRGKLHYRSKDMAMGGATGYAIGGGLGSLGAYSDGGRLLKGPGDGVSDSIPATIGAKQQPARLADGEFVIPARIVSELGNGSTDAGAKKLYAMMDRVQKARSKTTGKNKVAANSRADKYLPA